jgi:hypothetical protein
MGFFSKIKTPPTTPTDPAPHGDAGEVGVQTAPQQPANVTAEVTDAPTAAQNTPTATPSVPKTSVKPSSGPSFLERAAKDLDFLDTDGLDNETFGEVLSHEPRITQQRAEFDSDGDGEAPPTPKGKGIFSNLISDAPKSDEDLEAEIGGDLDGIAPDLAFDASQAIFPSLISSFKGEKDPSKYIATGNPAEKYKEALALWLKSKRVRVTPGANLVYRWAIAYFPIFGAIMDYVDRIQRFGWSWPWSTKWKDEKARQEMAAPGNRGPIAQPQPPAAPPPPPRPQPAPAPQPVAEPAQEYYVPPVPAPAPPPVVPQSAPVKMKACLLTNELFEEGKGYPKSSKSNPDLVDAFKEPGGLMGWKNKQAAAKLRREKQKAATDGDK